MSNKEYLNYHIREVDENWKPGNPDYDAYQVAKYGGVDTVMGYTSGSSYGTYPYGLKRPVAAGYDSYSALANGLNKDGLAHNVMVAVNNILSRSLSQSDGFVDEDSFVAIIQKIDSEFSAAGTDSGVCDALYGVAKTIGEIVDSSYTILHNLELTLGHYSNKTIAQQDDASRLSAAMESILIDVDAESAN